MPKITITCSHCNTGLRPLYYRGQKMITNPDGSRTPGKDAIWERIDKTFFCPKCMMIYNTPQYKGSNIDIIRIMEDIEKDVIPLLRRAYPEEMVDDPDIHGGDCEGEWWIVEEEKGDEQKEIKLIKVKPPAPPTDQEIKVVRKAIRWYQKEEKKLSESVNEIQSRVHEFERLIKWKKIHD